MAYKQGKNPFSRNPLNFNSPLNSFDSLVGKLMNQGKSKEAATKIAGKVANMKMKGAGSGPTAAQKARAKGSAAKMEDLSGDGKITKKDVLIGRGVIEKDGSPAKAHDKKLKALERRIKRVRQSKEGSEGQGGIDYELLAQLEEQKKKLIESHGQEAKDGNAKPSPANLKSPVEHHIDKSLDARGNKKQEPLSTSIKSSKITDVKGDDAGAEVKIVRTAKRLTQADLDKNKSTAKSKGIVSSEGRDGSNRQERKKRRQERRSIRRNKDLSASQKRMAIKESRQQQKDNVRGVKKDSPAKIKTAKQKAGGSFDKPLSDKRKAGLKKRKAIIKRVRKEGEAKVSASIAKGRKKAQDNLPLNMKSPMNKDGKKGDLLSRGVDAAKKIVKKAAKVPVVRTGKKVIKAVKKFAKEQKKVAT